MILSDPYLQYLANLTTQDRNLHDELVQEGRIKLWQMEESGRFTDRPRQYFVVAVKKRMLDLCMGNGRATGHTGRRGVIDATATKPAELGTLLEDPAFDERRLRPVVAPSKLMTPSRWASEEKN